MADEERDINETNTRGTDWEVVSLTASAYAAAPGPQRFDPEEQHKNQELSKTEQDGSEAMFMSKHFVFPQEPECLPSDHYHGEIHKNCLDDEKFSEPHKFNKDKGKIDSVSELFDTGHSFSDHSMDFGDGKQEQDLKIVEKEHDLFVTPIYSNLDEAFMSSPLVYEGISELAEPRNPSPEKSDYPSWHSHGYEPHEEDDEKCDESHEAWWKKRAMSVYNHAKGTNTFWSIFVVVAMAGFVILGQRWRREKSYFQQFKWKFSGPDEVRKFLFYYIFLLLSDFCLPYILYVLSLENYELLRYIILC
ncbi:hypothetical protein KSP39_PZI008668 [Platanthera zijinensis]|uniref:Uncharacterized protein n=1 Tax=Platanthera zijinensis TaxID=2320716 RepID=A0AAP0G8K9_9ASPA